MNCLKIFIQILTISRTFAIHEINFFSINCSTSPKKSIEVGICEYNGNKASVELNYVRSIDQHYVR